MSERSLAVNPVIEPCAGAVIGLGIGYSLAPRKYSLKQLLILQNDRFDKIYSNDLVDNMNVRERNALENLKQARQICQNSQKSNFEQIKTTASDWMQKFRKVDVSEDLQISYKTSRESLQKAIKETNYIELNKAYRAAKAAVKQAPDNEQLKVALKLANINLSKAKAVIASKIDLYKGCVKNIANERLANIKNKPVKYADVREAYRNFLKALAKRRTALSNKIFELSNNKKLINDYNALKDYLPKARSKSVLTGALVMGSITTMLVNSLSRSVRKSA